MALLNTDSYVELIQQISVTSENTLNGFDLFHAVIYGRFYMLGYAALFIGYLLKMGRDAAGMKDSVDLGNLAVMAGVVGLLILPVDYESPESGEQLKVAFGYKVAKSTFVDLLGYMASTSNDIVKSVYENESQSSYSPVLAMFQNTQVNSIVDAVGDPNVITPYHHYRSYCHSFVGQNTDLSTGEQSLLGFNGESSLGKGDTLRYAYEVTRVNLGDVLSSTRDFDEVVSSITSKQVVPEDLIGREYNIVNGAYLKAELSNEKNSFKLYLPTGSMNIMAESGSNQFIAKFQSTGVNTDTAPMYNAFKEGFAEYQEYLNNRLSEYPNPELRAYLSEPGMPLSSEMNGGYLKLVPIDCISFAMIANLNVNQVTSAIGTSSLLTGDSIGQVNANEENGFLTRMIAVNLAMHTLSSSYRSHEVNKEEEVGLFDRMGHGLKNGFDTIKDLYVGGTEVKEKFIEGYALDAQVPTVMMGLLLTAGLLIACLPIVLTTSFVLPDGSGIIINLIKLIIFLLASLILSMISLQFIDAQITQSVNEWLKANYNNEIPSFMDSVSLPTSTASADIDSSLLGSDALTAKLLAASEASKYAYFMGIAIAFSIVFDLKALLRMGSGGFGSVSRNSGKAPAEIAKTSQNIAKTYKS